jgi:RNA polymerase sigma-70 factor (ECF subfamily)
MDNPYDDTDDSLVKACQGGNTEAFRLLYRRHQRLVRSTLFHLCDPITLDDLVQEVFLRAWRGLPALRGEARFSTWLYRIAWNVGADYRRQVAKTLNQQEKLQTFSNDPSSTQWQELHHQDLVQRGLQTLPEAHAIVLILSDLEDLSQPEIAKILEIPVGTVKSRLFHARSTLRKFFQQEGVTL